jgi:hypothetical protein
MLLDHVTLMFGTRKKNFGFLLYLRVFWSSVFIFFQRKKMQTKAKMDDNDNEKKKEGQIALLLSTIREFKKSGDAEVSRRKREQVTVSLRKIKRETSFNNKRRIAMGLPTTMPVSLLKDQDNKEKAPNPSATTSKGAKEKEISNKEIKDTGPVNVKLPQSVAHSLLGNSGTSGFGFGAAPSAAVTAFSAVGPHNDMALLTAGTAVAHETKVRLSSFPFGHVTNSVKGFKETSGTGGNKATAVPAVHQSKLKSNTVFTVQEVEASLKNAVQKLNDPMTYRDTLILLRRLTDTRDFIGSIVKSGVVPFVIQLAEKTPDPEIQVTVHLIPCCVCMYKPFSCKQDIALTIVVNVAVDDTKVVIDNNGLTLCLNLLFSKHAKVMNTALWLLANIAADDEYQFLIPKAQGDKILMSVAANFDANPSRIHASTFNELWTRNWDLLARIPDSLTWIRLAPALPRIVKLLAIEYNDPEILLEALKFLSVVVLHFDESINPIIKLGAVPILIRLVSSSSTNLQITRLTIRILGNISSHESDEPTQHLLDSGVIPRLCSLLNGRQENILQASCFLISNIAAGNASQIQGNQSLSFFYFNFRFVDM